MSHEDLLREHHDQLQGTGGFTNSRFKFGKPKLRKPGLFRNFHHASKPLIHNFTSSSSRWIGSEMVSSV
jgi:hypothetical protein